MPELATLERQLSSIHLPDIDGNEVLHSLSELSLPEVNLERLEHLRPDISQAIAGFEWPAWLAMLDVGGSRAQAARAARIRRQTLWLGGASGLMVVGLGAVAILAYEPLRTRLWQTLRAIRSQVTTIRTRTDDQRDEPAAFDAARTAPLDTSRDAYRIAVERADYPSGLGSNENGTRVPEESVTTG